MLDLPTYQVTYISDASRLAHFTGSLFHPLRNQMCVTQQNSTNSLVQQHQPTHIRANNKRYHFVLEPVSWTKRFTLYTFSFHSKKSHYSHSGCSSRPIAPSKQNAQDSTHRFRHMWMKWNVRECQCLMRVSSIHPSPPPHCGCCAAELLMSNILYSTGDVWCLLAWSQAESKRVLNSAESVHRLGLWTVRGTMHRGAKGELTVKCVAFCFVMHLPARAPLSSCQDRKQTHIREHTLIQHNWVYAYPGVRVCRCLKADFLAQESTLYLRGNIIYI